ncbi:YsnF/AvaK domain-containing protein [Belnapia sp. T6]|uniref:YsnF/AvaK domain-containing protein n=1 Tax=Belnapia mucosa TaxID=2804532 RepID=A0ABS1VBQ4_9PROT|nr:YsnF/AvaK domain-containing protein [Belnapia mucosa]MBL6459057.1 YsnF/AvaK domain-containing protein [Belnapia mucosa]
MSPEHIIPGCNGDAAAPSDDSALGAAIEQVAPLIEEVLRVGKRSVENGRVRVSLRTEAVEERVRSTLGTRRAEVERVQIGHEVSEPPQTRQEGDVLIVPVVEQILVVERRLVLKEEIHLRFVDDEEIVEQLVERRVQHATIERVPTAGAAPPTAGTDQ